VFYLVSKPDSPWAPHAQILFIIAPFFEGLMGGWSTIQASTSAYISDCTSDGSRAQLFSRMTGVIFLGLAIGPALGAFIMNHPVFSPRGAHTFPSMTAVFEAAVVFNLINVALLFLYPESLNTKHVEDNPASDKPSEGFFESILGSLTIFLPTVKTFSSGRKRRDWSFTFLACGVFAAMFSFVRFSVFLFPLPNSKLLGYNSI
jgi:Major Facilitator Superfamily